MLTILDTITGNGCDVGTPAEAFEWMQQVRPVRGPGMSPEIACIAERMFEDETRVDPDIRSRASSLQFIILPQLRELR